MSDRPAEPDPVTQPLPSSGAGAGAGSGAASWAIPSVDTGSAAPAAEGGDEPGPDDLDLLDSQWSPPRRTNRITVLLTGGLVAVLGFVAGALVQRSHDTDLVGRSAGASARAFSRGGGTEGFGGFGGLPAQDGQGGAAGSDGGSRSGGRGSGGSGDSGGRDSSSPVVVGTVVSVGSATLVVQNFAGTKVTVRVPPGTPVTTAGLTGLTRGVMVSVAGAKASDGTVTASSVTTSSVNSRRLG
jgi:hypothetical protein